MDLSPSCTESENLNLLKNEIVNFCNFPFIDIKIKEEEVDLGEDTIEVRDEDIDSLILCPECAYTTHSETQFLRHCKHHQDSDKDKNVLTCAECEYTTAYRGDLNIHTITKHPRDEKLISKQAEPETTKPNPEETPKFCCGSCDFRATRKRNLCRHLILNQTHTLKNDFVCGGRCQFKTKFTLNLIRHLRRDHSQFFYKEIVLADPPKHNKAPAEPDNTIYKCCKCKFQGQRYLLQSHMAKKHPHIHTEFFSLREWQKSVAYMKKSNRN